LTANDLYGSVAESDEEDPGGFIYFNLDNDNDSNNSLGTPKRPGADYLETTNSVTGEDDLKSLSMSLSPSLELGEIILSAESGAKIWKSDTKDSTNLVVDSGSYKTWNLYNGEERNEFLSLCSSGLYVEGVATGNATVKLEYEETNGSARIHRDLIKYTFIAADCDRQPKTDSPDERTTAESIGNLTHCEWSITDDTDAPPYYNCIAWSVGETNAWYVDIEAHRMHGYDIVIDDEWGDGDGTMTTAELDAFYDAKGYEPSAIQPPSEPTGDVVIMYYSGFHGDRKRGCSCGSGKWIMFESKCGEWVKMEHVYNQLNGGMYGSPTRYYKDK